MKVPEKPEGETITINKEELGEASGETATIGIMPLSQSEALRVAREDKLLVESALLRDGLANLQEELDNEKQQRAALETKLQTDSRTLSSTRLELNRVRAELGIEKRKLIQAGNETKIKEQQLSFMQQECVQMHERLVQKNESKQLDKVASQTESSADSKPLRRSNRQAPGSRCQASRKCEHSEPSVKP